VPSKKQQQSKTFGFQKIRQHSCERYDFRTISTQSAWVISQGLAAKRPRLVSSEDRNTAFPHEVPKNLPLNNEWIMFI
jgi:hypothetical protein